jgi:hypothetical protein
MKIYKTILIFVITIFSLIACSGNQQAATTDQSGNQEAASQAGEATIGGTIPIYPNATDYKTGGNAMMDTMLNPMIQQFESQYGGNATVRFYSVPQGTTAQDIETFYNEKMNGMGWKAEAVPQQNTGGAPAPVTLVWNNQDKEIFVVSFMEIPQMEPILIAILAQQS